MTKGSAKIKEWAPCSLFRFYCYKLLLNWEITYCPFKKVNKKERWSWYTWCRYRPCVEKSIFYASHQRVWLFILNKKFASILPLSTGRQPSWTVYFAPASSQQPLLPSDPPPRPPQKKFSHSTSFPLVLLFYNFLCIIICLSHASPKPDCSLST